jgi:hypothetical protein
MSCPLSVPFLPLQDAEGILVANIRSYMGGVDLWKNEDSVSDTFQPQCMHDKMLEVVCFTGMLHLGRLQVGKKKNACFRLRVFAIYILYIDNLALGRAFSCTKVSSRASYKD